MILLNDSRDKVVFHTLRHTFASWLAINGTPIYTIKELMRHKSLSMTERYSHLMPSVKKEAMGRIKSRKYSTKAETDGYGYFITTNYWVPISSESRGYPPQGGLSDSIILSSNSISRNCL